MIEQKYISDYTGQCLMGIQSLFLLNPFTVSVIKGLCQSVDTNWGNTCIESNGKKFMSIATA